MKKILLYLFALLIAFNGWGQSSPGDIAFIAMNVDGGDDFAFVALVDISASANIYFTDNEWNGTAFNDLNEGEITWTNDASILSAGSVVVFTDPSTGGSVNVGSYSGSGWNLGSSNEWAYALLEAPATSYASAPTFLSAIASDAGAGWLTGTGLTEGTHAIDFNNDHDGFKYTGARDDQASFSAYLPVIMNSSNWQDEASNGELILPISTTAFSTTGVSPTITLNPSSLIGFNYAVGNGPSAEQSFTAAGSNLEADISLVPPTNYEISTGTGGAFVATNPITLAHTGGTVNETSIYVRLKAGLGAGNYNNEDITASSTNADNKTVTCSGTVEEPSTTTLPYSEAFDADLGDCYTYSVSGATKEWNWNTGGYAQMNGFNSGDTEEDWLILPGINLDNYSNEIMTFDTWYNYGSDDENNYLKLMYSTNYSGVGNPSGSTWTELSYTQPGSTQTWTSSGDINLSGISGTSVWIAFKYHYESGSYRSWGVDNLSIEEVNVIDPGSFSAEAASSSQIDLSFTTNVAGDNVVIAYDADGSFSAPSGAPPAIGEAFAGGTLLYNGTTSPQNHTGLASGQTVYYKAWSYDESNYSSGLTDNATTLKPEPTNYPVSFSATANSSSKITLTWTDAVGAQLPDNYLIKASTANNVSAPVDGTAVADNTTIGDDNGAVNVAYGVESYEWTGLNASTTYYFEIYPYTNSGSNINYKTDGSPPEANATTGESGSGTLESPYSCAEVIALNNPATTDQWVKGYIVGYFTGSTSVDQTAPFGGNTNLALADASDESDHNNMVSVQLIDNGLREILGLQTNSNNFGDIVLVRGDLLEYYSHKGVKNTDDYKWFSDPTVSSSGNWSSNTTWGHGKPGKNDNVIVSSGTLSIDETAACNNLTINNNASTTINDAITLSVHTTLTINNGGSFINNGTLDNGAKADANGVMQRSIDGWTTQSNGWHFLSSPVNNLAINGSDFDPGDNDDFHAWSETQYLWLNHKDPTNNITNFTNGLGYLVSYQATDTKDFTGTFNNSDITFNNLSKTSEKGEGWHLFGNPFQSALQWTNTDWVRTNFGVAAKIMNSGGSYQDITVGGTDIIPANQGFFVQTSVDGNNTFTIPKSQRVHNSTAFYKNTIPNQLTLKAIDGNLYQNTWIQFMDGSTSNFDENYDVRFLSAWSGAPHFYSVVGEEYLSTNRIPEPENENIVSLNFSSQNETNIFIQATGIDSFAEYIDIFLEDLQENIIVNLRENPEYSFYSHPDYNPERFKIHFKTATGINEDENDVFDIYSNNSNIYIMNPNFLNANVVIYNMMGQEVDNMRLSKEEFNSFQLNVQQGYYLVKVINDQFIITEKVYIK